MLQTDKVKLTWRDRFPAYFTNLVSIIFMVSSRRLEGLGIRGALDSSWDTMRQRGDEGHPSSTLRWAGLGFVVVLGYMI